MGSEMCIRDSLNVYPLKSQTSELSNEVLYILVAQGGAKLEALKVRPGRVSNPGLPKTGDFNT